MYGIITIDNCGMRKNMTENKNSKKKSLVWCIVILSVAAVLTVAIGIIALISSKAKTEPTPEPVNIKLSEPAYGDVVVDILEEKIDPEAPVLHGVRERFGYVGDNIDYTSGVFAIGKVGRSTHIQVDASRVDVNTPGSYEVMYVAIDSDGHYKEVTAKVDIYKSSTVRLDVQNIMQMPSLPNGCEVVSLAIALGYKGYQIPPTKLFDDFMPHSYGFKITDFWNYYIGDPRTEGCGCYAPCVVATANAFLESKNSTMKGYNVSGSSLTKLESYLDRDIPVILWGTMGMCGLYSEVAKGYVDGEWVYWNLFSHCMVMIGYDEDSYIFCDPMRGIVEYDKEAVEKSYNIAYQQACVIY